MKTVDEHNILMENYRKQLNDAKHLAGVSCNECMKKGNEVEMHYEDAHMVNLSNPPTRYVKCPECGFRTLKTVGL